MKANDRLNSVAERFNKLKLVN